MQQVDLAEAQRRLQDLVDAAIQGETVLIRSEGVAVQLVPLEEVLALVAARPPALHLVLTGRNAPQALIDRADLVTEMREIKHPWQQKIPAQQGIDY